MTDPRLNSVHLDAPRRQTFREARDVLLNARGWQTVAAENLEADPASSSSPHTMVLHAGNQPPSDLKCWLADREFLYPLKVGLNTIGRAPENDVVVQDAYVSRRHCAILVHVGERYELHDIASKNGTYINGRKLAGPTPLSPGDEIRMCDRQFVFMSHSGGDDQPPFAQTQTE